MGTNDPRQATVEAVPVLALAERVERIPYWYHRIELPGGIVTRGWAPLDPKRYGIPEDLKGKRVLDIGAWDGYWTWEALKRGAAEVVALDDFSDQLGADVDRSRKWETFDLCREAFGFTVTEVNGVNGVTSWCNASGQICRRCEASVYQLAPALFGTFDVVFFFGTLYHLKHPYLALQKIAEVCRGALFVETASLDEYSPYRGGIGKGYDRNDMVMEFYPTDQYGKNPANWWVPTLECLGAMMASVGFQDINAWPLTEHPAELSQCRGFASGTQDAAVCPATHPPDIVTEDPVRVQMRVAAVMSVPRLGFQDNMTCATQALFALHIPLINVQGAFWGQCLERGMERIVDSGAEVILTIDYDTLFSRQDVEAVLRLMVQHPEAAAIVPVQRGRGTFPCLMTMKGPSGNLREAVPLTELEAETVPIASGHFGLTALRVKDLLDIPHPWFWDQPNSEGHWGPGRVDADIWFWKQLEKAQKTVLLACRVPVGHLELMATWPDRQLQPLYTHPGDFHEKGRPENCWK